MAQGCRPGDIAPKAPNLPPQATPRAEDALPLAPAPAPVSGPGSRRLSGAGQPGRGQRDGGPAPERDRGREEAGGGTEEAVGGRTGLRGRQRPERQGQLPRRPVPVARDAQQGLHHAPGRLDAIRQRVVGPVPGPEGRSSGLDSRPRHEASASGDNLGGIGDLQDGDYFRRIRPFAEGTFWETGEYRLILALENNQFNTAGLDEFWVGETKIPVIGTVRVGHVKTPMGLEGDMTASSRCMTFMERSSYSQAIELDQNFVTGLWLSNNYFDQRVTWTLLDLPSRPVGLHRLLFGDDQWGWQGRLTALPIYEDEGRHLVHMGLSGGWRSGTTNLTATHRRIEHD